MASTTTSSKSTTPATLSRFYKLLLEQPMDGTQLSAEATRIDSGSTSLAEMLKKIYESPSRSTGRTDELAEAFFVLFDRAPDPTTFGSCMEMLRSGKSLADIIELGLGAPGYQLSHSGYLSHTRFINKAYDILTGGYLLPTETVDMLAAQIDSGQTTRAQLIANALESPHSLFHANRAPMVKTALLYMAAANQEASAAHLATASGNTSQDIQTALNSGGLTPTSTIPYFIKQSTSGSELRITGTADSDLIINLQSGQATLGGASGFKAQYSINGGFDASTVNFSASQLQNVTSIDASLLSGKGKLSFSGKSGSSNYIVTAPAAGSIALQGSDGNDKLQGGSGVDKLIASGGSDQLTGGEGADTFVLAKVSAYTAGAYTRITDLGNGSDTLDFSLLLGNAAPKSSSLKAISADTTSQTTLANGSVTLLDNNGRWGSSTPSATDIADLFGASGTTPSKPFTAPGTSGRHILITADLVNDAQIWLINNTTAVTAIASNEVTLIGQIDGDWNAMLNGLLPILK